MSGATGVKKVVLAYSGGLDTSVIGVWLQETFGCEIVTYTADIGQGEEVEEARAKAEQLGASEVVIEDLRDLFARDFVFPMFRCNTQYEGEYLLGTAIARPLIAQQLVEVARRTGADAIAHGATGKGNDQVRFELGIRALEPDLRVIAPWRTWDLRSRTDLLQWCEQRQIPVSGASEKRQPYSMDANLLHISYEGGDLEDAWTSAPEDMWRRTCSPQQAKDKPEELILGFCRGDAVALNGEKYSPAQLLEQFNELAGAHGIGRLDIVENRYVGMKARGCYETPGGTVLLKAHRAMESLTLDRELMHLKDELMPRYARLIYNGYWFSPERLALQKLIDETQVHVNGEVRLKLYKGSVSVTGRRSSDSLLDEQVATFENDGGAYDQQDAEGFINLNALRLAIAARRGRKL